MDKQATTIAAAAMKVTNNINTNTTNKESLARRAASEGARLVLFLRQH